jgi:acyl-CoA synthetase (AMP-forming)/AMP-acid ligase II
MNWGELLDIGAARTPGQDAVALGDASLTYAELRSRAARVAALVEAAGIAPGQKVAVLMHNALEYAEIGIGIAGAGAVLVPVNTRLAPPELIYVLDHAEAVAVFAGPEFADALERIREALPALRTVWTVGGPSDDYGAALAATPERATWCSAAPGDDCMIVYTSGTTGNAKGAVRSHASAMWGAANFTSALGPSPSASDRFLYPIPLASIGFLNVFGACLYAGLTAELMYRYDGAQALELIERKRVTHAYLVPSMWRMLLAADAAGTRDTSALRVGLWGGEPLDPRLRERILERFGPVLVGVFGTTEGALLSARPGDDAVRPCTSGRAAGYNIFRVVDDEGRELPRGQVGELINKSPTALSRYHRDEQATAETLRDGWYHTGDLAVMDDEGYVAVVDRKKEMLISGGQNIYPAEIERVLNEHPAVAASAVIGVPDEGWGEVGMAFVVAGSDTSAEALIGHAREHLARYKVPKHWHFVDALPTNANGKVRKHELRTLAQQSG